MRLKYLLGVSCLIAATALIWVVVVAFVTRPAVSLQNVHSMNGPFERWVYAVTADTTDPNGVCAGTWGDGPFCSDNGGSDWRAGELNAQEGMQDLEAVKVKAAARDPSDGKQIYIGTWQGIFHSANNGLIWNYVDVGGVYVAAAAAGEGSANQVNTLLFTEENGSTLYAGTRGGIIKGTPGNPNWENKNNGFVKRPIDVQTLIWDKATLYAGTYEDGIYASENGGNTWQQISSSFGITQVVSLVSPTEGVVYAGTLGSGVFKSTDSGKHWTPWNEGLDPDERARRVQALAWNASSHAIYAGTVDFGVYKLIEGETKWEPKNSGLSGYALSILTIATTGSNTLYIGTFGGGVYKSTDGGETWREFNQGISTGAPEVQTFAVDAQSKKMYVGTQGGGVYLQNSDGKWERENNGLPPEGPYRDIQSLDASDVTTNTLYAGTPVGLYRSSLAGDNLKWEEQVVSSDILHAPVTSVIHHDGILYAGIVGDQDHGGIYSSVDNGEHWNHAVNGISAKVTLNYDNENTIDAAFGSSADTVYESTNDGQTWGSIHGSPSYIQGLDQSRKNILDWILTGGARHTLVARSLNGLYNRQDDQAWQVTYPGVTGALTADPHHPGLVYGGILTSTVAAGDMPTTPIYGVILSQDDGLSWQIANKLQSPVTSLFVDPTNPDLLYIGTSNRGVYKANISVPSLWQTPRFALISSGTAFLALLLLNLLVVSYAFQVLPWQMLFALVTLNFSLYPLFAEQSSLTPLQQLVLALWNKPQARPEEIQQSLAKCDASTSWTQLTLALEALDRQHLLSKLADGAYRVRAAAVIAIARKRFLPRFEILAKSVREESHVSLDAQQFFRQAGYLPHPTKNGLILLSAHTEGETFVGIFAANAVSDQEIALVLERAKDEYQGEIEGREAFVVIAAPPQSSAYQRIAESRVNSPHLRMILLSHQAIRQALNWNTASTELVHSVSRIAPETDLYSLEGPAVDPLDFFGRQDLLRQIALTIDKQRVIGLQGIPHIGKSSLLWQLKERYSYRPCIYIDLALLRNELGDLSTTLTSALEAEAASWNFSWDTPSTPAAVTLEQEVNWLEETLIRYRDAMESRLPEPRLLLLVDSVFTQQPLAWNKLIEICNRHSFIDLALGFIDRESDTRTDLDLLPIQPFSLQETSELAQALLRPLGSTFESSALDRIYTETGGHPQLVRHLCSEIVSELPEQVRVIEQTQVAQGARRYLVQRPAALREMWTWFSSQEQEILRTLVTNPAALSLRQDIPSTSSQTLEQLARYGVIRETTESFVITIGLVRAWLNLEFLALERA